EVPYPLGGEILPGTLVIGSRPTPYDDCSPNCGKVLVHNKTTWILYDPTTTTWLPMPSQSDPAPTVAAEHGGGSGGVTAQIVVGQCLPQYCGQVLMIYSSGPNDTGGPFAELWNPKTAAFTPLGYVVPNAPSDGVSVIVLRDGKVLIMASGFGTPKWTRIFNPTASDPAMVFEFRPNHLLQHYGGHDGAVLNSGNVLFIGDVTDPRAEVFDGRSWTAATSCGGSNDYCYILTAFDDGKQVLAISLPRGRPYFTTAKTAWRFDSTRGWRKTMGPPLGASSVMRAAVIGGPQCTSRCGQIVTVGGDPNTPADRGSTLYISPP
ncbi:MAG: hypothetical protein M3256_24725, partial [Actinomycetota bacterium]|nr:hypothetical protein [Actinomycetota bacterium]